MRTSTRWWKILVGALDKFNVKPADKNTLLGVLGPMKSDIVEK